MTFDEAKEDINNIKIMNTVTSRFYNQIPRDILKQCKMLGLWKAMKAHDFSQKRKFTTSLYKYVLWECQKEIRSKMVIKTKKDKLDQYVYMNSFDSTSPKISLGIIKQLPENEMSLVYDRFYLGLTYKEMGQQRNLSKQTTERRLKKVLKDIKNGVYGDVGLELNFRT
jgi:DNA-directed RNA polymerase specialized sigma subunit